MADVYRRGTKSVHRGNRFRPELDVESIPECAFDVGGEWGPSEPAGARCEACFGQADQAHGRSGRTKPRGRSKAAFAGTAAALALAAVVFAATGTPVNILGPYPTASGVTPFASVTPEPVPPSAPALTPAPTNLGPVSTWLVPPIPTYPPAPTFGPLPTWPPLPTIPPLPVPKVCVHPGTHLGVDACKWPGNR